MFFLKPKTYNLESRTGQTMILTVIVLSGTLLSITLTAGLIMLYQIREAGNFTNTTKAVFAADTGINWWLYFNSPSYISSNNSSTINGLLRANGANFEILEEAAGIKVIGQAGSSKRAFLIQPVASPP